MKRPAFKMPQDKPDPLFGTKVQTLAPDHFAMRLRPVARYSRRSAPPAGESLSAQLTSGRSNHDPARL
jgi:hypothetical protein